MRFHCPFSSKKSHFQNNNFKLLILFSSQRAGDLESADLRNRWKGLGSWHKLKILALDKQPQKVADSLGKLQSNTAFLLALKKRWNMENRDMSKEETCVPRQPQLGNHSIRKALQKRSMSDEWRVRQRKEKSKELTTETESRYSSSQGDLKVQWNLCWMAKLLCGKEVRS